MSHPSPHDDGHSPLKARPRRPFDLSSSSQNSTQPPSPSSPTDPTFETLKRSTLDDGSSSSIHSRTRSFLNLTSSTLFGIYQPTGYDTNREDATPWGTGAQTPIERSRNASFDFSSTGLRADANGLAEVTTPRREGDAKLRRQKSPAAPHHHKVRRGFRGYILPALGRVVALFGLGVLYGLLISHLHNTRNLTAVKLDIDRSTWNYLIVWGTAGIFLGEALPWFDKLWAGEDEDNDEATENSGGTSTRRDTRGVGAWMDVVRSIGAFVGIAFAIRRLPWQSTLQLSLTLALANPAVWYLIDRSPPGLILSAAVALSGTAVVVGVKPTWIPPPSLPAALQRHDSSSGTANGTTGFAGSEELVLGLFSQESVGVVTWIASVLFVSTVCFGNLGRRLAPKRS